MIRDLDMKDCPPAIAQHDEGIEALEEKLVDRQRVDGGDIASMLRMPLSLLSRECHTDVKPHRLPERKSGILIETFTAATNSQNRPRSTRAILDTPLDDDDSDPALHRR